MVWRPERVIFSGWGCVLAIGLGFWVLIGDSSCADVGSADILASACLRRVEMSRSRRNEHAASRRSGVSSDITPIVKCIAPSGRMAFAGRGVGPSRSVTSVVAIKREMEAWSWGREVGVTSGRQRKCVN